MTTKNPTEIFEVHCQQCGATDYESIAMGDDGYTACCNEIAMDECDLRFCSHGCEYPATGEMFEAADCLVHGKAHDR